jgi:hypothetical protein
MELPFERLKRALCVKRREIGRNKILDMILKVVV